MMAIDAPMPGTTMSGRFSTCGWASDHSVVSSVPVTLDGAVGGTTDYGQPRQDVACPGIALRGTTPSPFAIREDSGKSLAGHATRTLKERSTPSFNGARIADPNLNGGGGGLCSVELAGTGTKESARGGGEAEDLNPASRKPPLATGGDGSRAGEALKCPPYRLLHRGALRIKSTRFADDRQVAGPEIRPWPRRRRIDSV
jgi:hypothetical protein